MSETNKAEEKRIFLLATNILQKHVPNRYPLNNAYIDAMLELYNSRQSEIDELKAEIDRLKESIHWALGYTDFRPQLPGEGAYYWRKELRERSGITNEDIEILTNKTNNK